MEEEIKEMKKLIKIYNNFILFAPILKEPLLLFIAIANITMLILETRTENGILWLFLALFLCGLMIFFYTFWNWNYNILFLGKVGIVQLTVFLIDNYSAEIISLFMQMLFISCFLVASYIVGLVILKIFRKWKWLINFQSKKFIEDEEEEEPEWLFIGKEERMKLSELQKKKKQSG